MTECVIVISWCKTFQICVVELAQAREVKKVIKNNPNKIIKNLEYCEGSVQNTKLSDITIKIYKNDAYISMINKMTTDNGSPYFSFTTNDIFGDIYEKLIDMKLIDDE